MCIGIDCDRKAECLGKYCTKHYNRFKRHGDAETVLYAPDGSGYIKKGYRYMFVDGKKIAEHVLVATEKYGRSPEKNEIVHHVNHNKLDNRADNLVILDRADHVSYHQIKSEVVDGTRKCTKCGVIKNLSEFRSANSRSGKRSECKSCGYEYSKDYYHKNKYTKPHLWDLDLTRLNKLP